MKWQIKGPNISTVDADILSLIEPAQYDEEFESEYFSCDNEENNNEDDEDVEKKNLNQRPSTLELPTFGESRHASGVEWVKDVQICFKWSADGDPGQCNGEQNRETCSSYNFATNWYFDDTDNRSGGCNLSWKITIPNQAPNWAKTLKLCFFMFSDGDLDRNI